MDIKIYQIEDIENVPYAFMPYDRAKDMLNIDDYALVADTKLDDEDLDLETIFTLGNTDKSIFQPIKPMRSISVSDIIEVDGIKYYVDSFGFKRI